MALLSNQVYRAFKAFGYQLVETTPEDELVNLIINIDSRINLSFPSLNGLLHLGDYGQIFIASVDEGELPRWEKLLAPVGTFESNA